MSFSPAVLTAFNIWSHFVLSVKTEIKKNIQVKILAEECVIIILHPFEVVLYLHISDFLSVAHDAPYSYLQ